MLPFTIAHIRDFGQKNRIDFGVSISAYVDLFDFEYKSLFLLRFISIVHSYLSKHVWSLNEPLQYIIAKIKIYI